MELQHFLLGALFASGIGVFTQPNKIQALCACVACYLIFVLLPENDSSAGLKAFFSLYFAAMLGRNAAYLDDPSEISPI